MDRRQDAPAILRSLIEVVGQWYRYCPWARKQTLITLVPYVLEEAREVADVLTEYAALPAGSPMPKMLGKALVEELGDLLLQVVQLCELGQQAGWFCVTEVIEEAVDKVVRRNPHVFGGVSATTQEEVEVLWQQAKREEHQAPATLPWSNQRVEFWVTKRPAVGLRSTRVAMEEWLQHNLPNEGKAQRDLLAEASTAGFSLRTLKRAKARLGIQSQRRGFGPGATWHWMWAEPRAVDE